MCDAVYKLQFEQFEAGIFFKFWTFSTQPKTNLSLCIGPYFTLLSQYFFILGWLSQSTLARVIKLFFFLKIKVIKLLIIYLILKVNKNINIQRGCGAVQFSYYKTAKCTTPCSVVHCYLWCGAIISFFKQFWCDFCSLCGLVNTPNENYCANSITLTELTHSWVFFYF